MRPDESLDGKFLLRCLELAARGAGLVSPNPMVGCVIVKNGRIIGEGYHARFGGPHAEIEALRRAGRKAHGGTLYVNLEPCSHHGKTPPCADAIVNAGIRRVVTSAVDPNPLVAGRGIRFLRSSGVEVTVGTLRRESEKLNEIFFTFMKTRLPFVGLKVAQTLDGNVADSKGDSKWITSKVARAEAHRIRSRYDAILAGANTIRTDNPQLTVRFTRGRNPLRVILDPQLRIPTRARVFSTKEAETLVFTSADSMSKRKATLAELTRKGVRVLGMDRRNAFDVRLVLQILAALGVSSVLVEGGPVTSSQFLERGLVNKLHWFVAPRITGGGLRSISLTSPLALSRSINLKNVTLHPLGPDYLIEGTL
jgi:diaminohydroxyphosphoribosylaminopyrimidine deaminase/5-amino-6-(5-phosphoribosylamino)uracil reductase